MLVQSAEESFREGMAALGDRRFLEAQALFEAAVAISRRLGDGPIQPRYLSFYGLCLARHSHRRREGVNLCRQATAKESYNVDLYHNLGESLMVAGRLREAYAALRKGLELQPEHAGIQRALARMGSRRRPFLPFLSRANPINVAVGKLSYVLRR